MKMKEKTSSLYVLVESAVTTSADFSVQPPPPHFYLVVKTLPKDKMKVGGDPEVDSISSSGLDVQMAQYIF